MSTPDNRSYPVWSIETLPDPDDARWETWVKRPVPVRMFRVKGPCRFVTIDGVWSDLPEDWEGFVAVDADGYPYPLHVEVHAKSYAAGEPRQHPDPDKGN